jgi:hypothetical protein
MRTQIFRTDPVLVDDTGVVIALKDMDGADPFDLFVENVDIAASLRTKFGSKNANVRFVAVNDGDTAGALGNDISITITAAPDQTFSVDAEAGAPYNPYTPYGGAVVINLRCDKGGRPNQFVSEVIDLLNADTNFAAILRAVRAQGSDGSAVMEAPDPDGAPEVIMPLTYLSGGFTATALGAVTVEFSPNGAYTTPQDPDMTGPWVAIASAATAFGSSISAGSVKVWSSTDEPTRGMRVKANKGSADTMVVVTAVTRKKGGV